MSIKETGKKITSVDWYTFLYAALLALLLVDYFSLMTPAFAALPSEFGGAVRLILGLVAILRFIFKKDKLKAPFGTLLPVLAGIGLAVYLGSGYLFVLDIALLKMASIDVKPGRHAFSLWATTFVAFMGTNLLARKGYIRDYTFNGFNACGFTKSYFALIMLALILVSFILTIVFYIIDRKNLNLSGILYPLITGIICVGIVFAVILKLDRTRALSDGLYTIYASDTTLVVEMHMHGIEDYDLSFDTHEAQDFEVVWEGQYYGIYADTDGVKRSLCVVDGKLVLGDYEESKAAHGWVIEALPGTPYFWIQNAETGYLICLSESGTLRLEMQDVQGRINNRFLMRLGDENLDYFESVNSVEQSSLIDISSCDVSFDVDGTYSGEAVTGNLALTYNGAQLIEGFDYTVEYVDNYYPGEATVYVRGIGTFDGEIVLNFEITIDNTMYQYTNSDKVQEYIFRAYRLGFNRLPTPEEFYSFKEYICLTMQTPDTLLWNLLGQGAFANSNAELVEGIYRLMLQRDGTRGEYDLWVNALDAGTPRDAVINEIVNSPDYQNIWSNFNLNFQ